MKLKIKNNIIFDENGDVIGALASGIDAETAEQAERTIELGSEAIPAIEKFIKEVNSGSFKPRTVVKEFEKLVEKYSV